MLWLGLAVTVLITLVFNLTDLDIQIQTRFYSPDSSAVAWPVGSIWIWNYLYRFGTIPGIIAGVGAILLFGASFTSTRLLRYRYPSLFLILVMIIGPGLIVNGIGKGLFGRPRPADLVIFGGMWDFLPPFVPGIPGRGRSFLCGHCSPGFFFMAFFFILTGWRKWASLAFGSALGLMMGTARMLQGSHFTSDVLLCGGIMLAIQAILAPVSRKIPDQSRAPVSPIRVALITLIFAAVGIAVALLSSPVYKEERFLWREPGYSTGVLREDKVSTWSITAKQKKMVKINMKEGDAVIKLSGNHEPLMIHSIVKGFGFPGAWRKWEAEEQPGLVSWRIIPTGTYSEFNGRIEATYSPAMVSKISLKTGGGAAAIRLDGYPGKVSITCPKQPAEIPAGFVRKGTGPWVRPGKIGIPPVVVEVEANSVTVIP